EWLRQALADSTQPPASELRQTIQQVVRRQLECGLDVVNDGEFGKQNFYRYVAGRVSGLEMRPPARDEPPWASIQRDANEFGEYYERRGNTLFGRGTSAHADRLTCVGPLRYVG